MRRQHQNGSVVTYALIAIFLTGLMIAAMTQGARKSADTVHIDEMMLYLQGDIKTIQGAINECVQTYPKAVDANSDGVDDNANPNVPFPLYGDLSSGGAGSAIDAIKCPGAPASQQVIFSGNMGNKLKLLADTSTYTTTYLTDSTEGAYIRITRAAPEALWTEAISRLNGKFSACSAAAVTAAGTCANGCFYYWIVRRATSAIGGEAGCP